MSAVRRRLAVAGRCSLCRGDNVVGFASLARERPQCAALCALRRDPSRSDPDKNPKILKAVSEAEMVGIWYGRPGPIDLHLAFLPNHHNCNIPDIRRPNIAE